MMVVGIVLIASIFVSVFISWDSDRGIERDIGSYFLRFLAGMSLIVFGNVTRDIATRKPGDKESDDKVHGDDELGDDELVDDAVPTLYTIENPFDSKSDNGRQRR
jgi:hypothetical protein